MPSFNILVVHFTTILLVPFLARASESDVEWLKPVSGDTFSPGEIIESEWRATPAVVSPSFRLCTHAGKNPRAVPRGESESHSESGVVEDDVGDCGPQIWPEVRDLGDKYSTSMVAPNITKKGEYYVLMEDNFEKQTRSPVFTLDPSTAKSSSHGGSDATSHGSNPIEDPPSQSASAPLSAISPASSGPAPPVAPPPSNPQFPVSAPNSPNAPTPSSNPPLPPTSPPPASPVRSSPYGPTALGTPSFLAAHAPPPVAAIAVPASIAGAIVLLALILALDHCIKQRRLRKSEKEALAAKIHSLESASGSGNGNGSRTSSVYVKKEHERSRERERYHDNFTPVPLFMPTVEYTQIPRRTTRQAYAARTHPAHSPQYRYTYSASLHRGPTQSYSHTSNGSSPHFMSPYRTPSPHYSLPPMRTLSPLRYPAPPQVDTSSLPYTYAHERREERETVPVTQSILADYLLPTTAAQQHPDGLLPAPQRAHVRRVEQVPPLSDNPYIRSPRS